MSTEVKGRSANLLAALTPHVGKLRRYLFRRLRSPQDVDDAIQEVWLRLLRHDPASINNPLAYVLRTAHNVAVDTVARAIAERQHVVRGSDEFGRAAETIEEPATTNLAERLIDERQLEHALNELEETRAHALRLQMEGHSYLEIAARLEINAHKVENYLRDARVFLRTRLIK